MQTYFDNIFNLQQYKVNIECKYANIKLTGIIDEETISIPLGASLSGSLAAQSREGFLKGFGKALMGKFFGKIGESSVDIIETMGSSIKTYQNGAELSISFSAYFFPGRDFNPKNYKEIIYQISKLTQPKVKKASSVLGKAVTGNAHILYSALYDPSDTKKFATDPTAFDQDLICITIGSWFSKCGLFCTSANTEISTIVDENNKPFYVKTHFTFVPYRMQTYDDIKKMFRS